MNETYVTIVGNALHNPEWRKTANTGAVVTSFKIASTARRFSGEAGRWIDGNSLRVRVSCWRGLAENVKNSVTSGDPLIVTGRLFTRDWEDEKGVKRLSYELEATSIGHDLSKGRAVFERVKSATSTSVTEDAEAEQRVGGETTLPVPDAEAPTQFNDMSFEEALEGGLGLSAGGDPVGALRDGGFTADPVDPVAPAPDALEPVAVAEPGIADLPDPDGLDPDDPEGDGSEPEEPGQLEPARHGATGRRRGLRRRV